MKKDILLDKVTINEKGQYHGPYEDYWFNGNLWEKAHYVNGEAFGYSELNNQKGTEKIIYYFCR